MPDLEHGQPITINPGTQCDDIVCAYLDLYGTDGEVPEVESESEDGEDGSGEEQDDDELAADGEHGEQ